MSDELSKILSRFSGNYVVKKTIAGNTIVLWIGGEPKSENAQCLWIDPPWRIENSGVIEASSADFPWEREEDESKETYQARFDVACDKCNSIEKTNIKSISFNPSTADIELIFGNGRALRSFTTWCEEESWHFSNYKENIRYYVSAGKIEVESIA